MISIIIPTYNRKEQLSQCIDSILSQSYKNIEIIIVDDCSSDGTISMLQEKYQDNKIKVYVNEKNSGPGYSRKFGYEMSKGNYIIFCDDDDYYIDNDFFGRCIKNFDDKNISMICSNCYKKYEDKNIYTLSELNFHDKISGLEYLKNFQFNYSKPCSTFPTIFRKETLEKANFKNMKMVNDSSIYLRALLMSEYIQVDSFATGVYRIHSKNISQNIKAEFLIDNLDEKRKIYVYLKNNKIFNDAEKWFDDQIMLTVMYFILGSNPSKSEKKLVYNYIIDNYINGKKVIKEIKKREIREFLAKTGLYKRVKSIAKNILRK